MEQLFVVTLLVSLCSATSPPIPNVIPLDCNATQLQTEVAIDLINEDRDEGFLLRPVRVRSVFQQESERLPGAFAYYLDLDVIETECSVLSDKSWKECPHDISFHETIYGHCKAIIFISRTQRILKLLNYNCTLGTVPSRSIAMMCPDCPVVITDISPKIKAKANLLMEQFNKESNQTHYFKVDNIERVRTQYVFGQSYFFYFTIKETECLKTQTNVNPENCKSLKDHEAHVGFCKGSSYSSHTPDHKDVLQVTCEIYNPRDDQDDHDHKHGHCGHEPDSSKTDQGQEGAKVKPKGTGEAGQGKDAPGNCGHRRCPSHRGHKHHRCRHDHHHHHPHHDHHHHHDHRNDSHPHHHHHHHHHHHNHTSFDDGSSSEEHTDNKPFEKRSKGSVQIYYLSNEEDRVPVPTIVRLPPPERPGYHGKRGKHGKSSNIEFPSEPSKLNTCPGEPLLDLPRIIKDLLFA